MTVQIPMKKKSRETEQGGKSWMHSVNLVDKTITASLYMPFIKGGGVFVETDRQYSLGDPVFLLLTVGDDGKRFPVNGKVVWVCGENARADRSAGVGVQFPKDDSGESVKSAIEQMIGRIRDSLKKTATL
jgi:type IV pilus assembly protein PilZ